MKGYDVVFDKRYKLNKEDVVKIIELRKSGLSLSKIGRMFNVSYTTIKYWTEDDYRNKQRDKIRKKKTESKVRQRLKCDSKNRFNKSLALAYIYKEIDQYKYNKNKEDILILGISMKNHWIPYLRKFGFNSLRKIDDALIVKGCDSP